MPTDREEAIDRIISAVARDLDPHERPAEIGFRLYLLHAYTQDVPREVPSLGADHENELRTTFFAGVQHALSLMASQPRAMSLVTAEVRRMAAEKRR